MIEAEKNNLQTDLTIRLGYIDLKVVFPRTLGFYPFLVTKLVIVYSTIDLMLTCLDWVSKTALALT